MYEVWFQIKSVVLANSLQYKYGCEEVQRRRWRCRFSRCIRWRIRWCTKRDWNGRWWHWSGGWSGQWAIRKLIRRFIRLWESGACMQTACLVETSPNLESNSEEVLVIQCLIPQEISVPWQGVITFLDTSGPQTCNCNTGKVDQRVYPASYAPHIALHWPSHDKCMHRQCSSSVDMNYEQFNTQLCSTSLQIVFDISNA